MTLTGILVTLLMIALIGFVVYLIVTYIPMPEPFRQVIIVVCVILIVLYVLAVLSGQAAFPNLGGLRLR